MRLLPLAPGWTCLALVLVVGLACAQPGPKLIVSKDAQEVDTSLLPECPEGTEVVGVLPPDGTSAHCVRFGEDGTPVNEGPWVEWFRVDPAAPDRIVEKVRGTYRAGVREGEWKEFHPNGNEARVLPYERGQLEGVAREWDESGRLVLESSYQDGALEGKQVRYHENGKIAAVRKFRAGTLSGDSMDYFPSGQRKASGEYREGEMSGFWTYWRSNGEVCMKGRLIKGKRDGFWSYKASDGDRFIRYKRGRSAEGEIPSPEVCR